MLGFIIWCWDAVFLLTQTSFNDHFYYELWWTASLAERSPSLLVASDVAARGLDIQGVDHVIHYQVPFTVEVTL